MHRHLILFLAFWFILCADHAKSQIPDSSASNSSAIVSDKDTVPRKKRNILLKTSIGLGYMGGLYIAYKELDHPVRWESQRMKCKFLNTVSDVMTPLGLGRHLWKGVGGTFVLAYLTKNQKLQRATFLWAGSLLVNDLFTWQTKNFFQRHRPYTGHPNNTFDWYYGPQAYRSFPSAHTSNFFTTATVFATVYKDVKWVPPVAYGIATLMGFLRIYENAHWLTDVMGGAAIGYLSAHGVMALHKLVSKKYILIIPQIGDKFSSLRIIHTF
jgi:membrane-associated phospholipid phosphatase